MIKIKSRWSALSILISAVLLMAVAMPPGVNAQALTPEDLVELPAAQTLDHEGEDTASISPQVIYDIDKVSAGGHHSLVLRGNGSIYAFGRNSRGRLGIGDYTHRDEAVKIPRDGEDGEGLPHAINAVDICAGSSHSLVLLENGDVYSFGYGNDGELGHGSFGDVENVPLRIETNLPADADAVGIAAGGSHSLIVLDNGDVYSFGDNDDGQLGLGHSSERNSPQKIPREGEGGEGLPAHMDAVAVAAGGDHSLVLLENGDLYSFGCNDNFQLGLGHSNNKEVPTKISRGADGLPADVGVKKLSAGEEHSLVLLENGEIYSFGYGMYGRLGHDSSRNESVPRLVEELEGRNMISISAGKEHSLVVEDDGTAYSFGRNNFGQLGVGEKEPCEDYDPENGDCGICDPLEGEYCEEASEIVRELSPRKIEAMPSKASVVSASSHSLVGMGDQTLYSFGLNNYGQLGVGHEDNLYLPEKVILPEAEIVYGDVDGDRKVTVNDAVMVLRGIVGLIDLKDWQLEAGDVTGTGALSVDDAIQILRHVVEIIDTFPVEE